jgi:hypothetical protein
MDVIHDGDRARGPRSKGLRAAMIVAVIASAILFLLAYTQLGPPAGSNGPASTIGKSGEMKSPGGTSETAVFGKP